MRQDLKEDSQNSYEEDEKEDNGRDEDGERSNIMLEEVEREILERTLLLASYQNFGFVFLIYY